MYSSKMCATGSASAEVWVRIDFLKALAKPVAHDQVSSPSSSEVSSISAGKENDQHCLRWLGVVVGSTSFDRMIWQVALDRLVIRNLVGLTVRLNYRNSAQLNHNFWLPARYVIFRRTHPPCVSERSPSYSVLWLLLPPV